MADTDRRVTESERKTAISVGFYAAILTAVVTLVTFALALTAIPISGANCPGDCIDYPYLDTVAQFPRDYRWMLPAIVLIFVYVILMICIQGYASRRKQVYGQIGVAFAIMSATILASAYFIQFAVVPVSLMAGETEGITLLTQYNPHGIFIAMEELGYLFMSRVISLCRSCFLHWKPTGSRGAMGISFRLRADNGCTGCDINQVWAGTARSL